MDRFHGSTRFSIGSGPRSMSAGYTIKKNTIKKNTILKHNKTNSTTEDEKCTVSCECCPSVDFWGSADIPSALPYIATTLPASNCSGEGANNNSSTNNKFEGTNPQINFVIGYKLFGRMGLPYFVSVMHSWKSLLILCAQNIPFLCTFVSRFNFVSSK